MFIPEHLKTRKLRADALKEARKSAGIDKNELAKRSGISRVTIDKIEQCRGSWTVDTEIIYMQSLGLATFQPIYGEEGGKMVVIKMMMVPTK